MPFYPLSSYLPGGDSEHIRPWRDLVIGHGRQCTSGLCQDMRSAMDSMSNMWGAPTPSYDPITERAALLRSTHAHNPEGAVDCNYSQCQQLQSAMRSMCNMWGLASRFRAVRLMADSNTNIVGHMPNCGGHVCRLRTEAIIAFANSQRVTTDVARAAGGLTVGNRRGVFTYPPPVNENVTMTSNYTLTETNSSIALVLPTGDQAVEESTTMVCANGDACRYFRYHAQPIAAEYICTQCGKCSTCSSQCEYSDSWNRNNEDLVPTCCSCLANDHHHCSDCDDWVGSGEGNTCDECYNRAQEGESNEGGYAFNSTDVSHLIYNCDSCGRQVGSCTCVLAYL